MDCPYCLSPNVRTWETRSPEPGMTRRNRSCRKCGRRFHTTERLDLEATGVVKRDERVEPFSRAKIAKSLRKAAIKGSELTPREMDAFVERVTRVLLRGATDLIVRSETIGATVLEHMRDGTPQTDVTCIRYSMVFQGSKARPNAFKDGSDFIRWLTSAFDPAAQPRPATLHPVEVVNRYGQREPFDYHKLERSIGVAAKGRGTETQVESMARELGQRAMERLAGQWLVSTMQIAQEILVLLRDYDEIAYLRYASAVKRYASAEDFLREALWINHIGKAGN